MGVVQNKFLYGVVVRESRVFAERWHVTRFPTNCIIGEQMRTKEHIMKCSNV